MKSSHQKIIKLYPKLLKNSQIACGFACLVIFPAYALGPTYEEDMARQHEQEQQIMEENYSQGEEAARQEQEFEADNFNPQSASPTYSPLQAMFKEAVRVTGLAAESADNADKLTKDPKYQQYQNGAWDFFQAKEGAAPGEYCAAFYWKKDGFVRLSGPGGDYRGAMMTFWGHDIPRPANQTKVRVTLKQSKDQPQTVEAFNNFTPGDEYGFIAFAVPSVEALLGGMEDVQEFELEIDGKAVAKVDWHSGLMAQKKLADCVNAKK